MKTLREEIALTDLQKARREAAEVSDVVLAECLDYVIRVKIGCFEWDAAGLKEQSLKGLRDAIETEDRSA